MDYTSKKRVLTEKFDTNVKAIASYQQAIQQLTLENASLQGQFKLIEDLEKEVMSDKKPKSSKRK